MPTTLPTIAPPNNPINSEPSQRYLPEYDPSMDPARNGKFICVPDKTRVAKNIWSLADRIAQDRSKVVEKSKQTAIPPIWEFNKLMEIAKYFSPITISPYISDGNTRVGNGYNVSFGLPKILPLSVRVNLGEINFLKDGLTGLPNKESRKAIEFGAFYGLLTYIRTKYESSNGNNQTSGAITIGPPMHNLSTTNDMDPLGDGGDRFQYGASGSIQWGMWSAGFRIGTGDPGPDRQKYKSTSDPAGGKGGFYVPYTDPVTGKRYDPDRYRMGIAYIGYGGLKVGLNSEGIRVLIQNILTHDPQEIPFFRDMRIPQNHLDPKSSKLEKDSLEQKWKPKPFIEYSVD